MVISVGDIDIVIAAVAATPTPIRVDIDCCSGHVFFEPLDESNEWMIGL